MKFSLALEDFLSFAYYYGLFLLLMVKSDALGWRLFLMHVDGLNLED